MEEQQIKYGDKNQNIITIGCDEKCTDNETIINEVYDKWQSQPINDVERTIFE